MRLVKWRLIFQSLPYAIFIVIAKLFTLYFLHFEGILDIQEIRIILTSGVFLVGFMLAGTMTDYKESEKIPGQIASALETIEETTITMAIKCGEPTRPYRLAVLKMSNAIYDWLYKRIDNQQLYEVLSEYNQTIQKIDAAGGAPPIIGRLINDVYDLRRLVTRTRVISETGFLATGYALLELIIVIISVLMLATKFHTLLATIFIIFFVELIYVYMYKLIRDIDDPFEYEEDEIQGAAEVALFPLSDYIKRLSNRLDRPY